MYTKFYRFGLEVGGKRAYCFDWLNFLCSYDQNKAIICSYEIACKGRDWLGFMMPAVVTFMEPVGAVDDDGLFGSESKDCAACDSGHCEKH